MTINEFLLLLGEKDVVIYQLNKQIAELQAKIKELEASSKQ